MGVPKGRGGWGLPVPGYVDNVANHRAGSGAPAGAA